MYSGENLRKYNILLQNTLLGIENPHMIDKGFLNENCTMNQKSLTKISQPVINDNQSQMLQLMGSYQDNFSNIVNTYHNEN